MTNNREELKGLFDLQIDRMLQLIDEQLQRMEKTHPSEQIVECPYLFIAF